MKYPSVYETFPMLRTSVTVSVGRGEKRHRLILSIQPRDGRLVALAGQTYCGSQRFMSGWHSVGEDRPTCEKCARRNWSSDTAPFSDLVEVKHGRFVVRDGVEIEEAD